MTKKWVIAAAAVALLVGLREPGAASATRLDFEPPHCFDRSGPFPVQGVARGGPASGAGASDLVVLGDTVFFAGCDQARGWELWRTDGREFGTRRISDIRAGRDHSFPDQLVVGDGVLFFTADDGVHGRELWSSDGTLRGTRLVADISPGPRGSHPFQLLWSESRSRLYFAADDGVHGEELWATDGTSDGTVLVGDANPGGGSSPRQIQEHGATIYFFGRARSPESPFHEELYAVVDDDIVSVTRSEFLSNGLGEGIASLGDAIVFAAEHPDQGAGLWRVSDPREGPERLDLGPDWPPFAVGLTEVGGALYFATQPPGQPRYQRELFRSDGTRSGTIQLSAITGEERYADGLQVIGDEVYFHSKAQDAFSRGLYVSDGTIEGTRLVADVHLGTCRQLAPGELIPVGDRIFFVGHEEVRGELWVTDGTEEGTQQVRDIFPGRHPSKPRDTVVLGDRLVFTANDGKHGRELWISDGTYHGTYMVKDIFAPKRKSRARLPFVPRSR